MKSHRLSVCAVIFTLPMGRMWCQQTAAVTTPRQLSLAQGEELLVQRNQLIAASRYQVEVSEALRRIAGYKPNPVLHLGAEQVPIQSPVAGSVPRFFTTNSDAGANPVYTAQVTKIFERGGKRELRVGQADATVEASRAQALDAFRTQLFQLRQFFTNAILARENLKLAESIDQQYGETERLTVVRVAAGDLAGVEVSRVRAARVVYRQAVLDAQSSYQQATRDILNVLDIHPGSEVPVAPTSNSPTQAPALPAGLQNAVLVVEGELSDAPLGLSLQELRTRAMRDRPDAMAARNALRAAEIGTDLAEAQRKRDLAVGVEYQRVGSDHSLGITTDVPLFAYNNQKAAIAQSVAQRHVAEAQVRQIETQVLTDVDKAYVAWQTARQAMDIYGREGVQEATRVRDVISYSYRRGEASLFELLDAQRTASQAALAANQARGAYQLALWQLEQAIGGSLR